MTDWEDTLSVLKEIILEHFPDTEREDNSRHAEKIFDEHKVAGSLQWIQRSDTVPLDDIEGLKKAAASIRKSADEVRKLGWHGSGEIEGFAKQMYKMNAGLPGLPILSREDAVQSLAKFLDGYASKFTEAAHSINPDAPSVMSAFGSDKRPGRPRGRPAETHAQFVTRECYDAFAELSGSRPKVITGRLDGIATGRFLAFVTDIFGALDIGASAEASARLVCKEKKPKKN